MMNFYSIESEVRYRQEQMNNSLPRVETNDQQKAWFKLKELYSRFTSTSMESRSECNYECACC